MSLDVYLEEDYCDRCERGDVVFTANITHNLNKMAMETTGRSLYYAMWRPEEIAATNASDIIDVLKSGLDELLSEPERFKKLNPENGWGRYDGLVKFVKRYHSACLEHPTARITVSR